MSTSRKEMLYFLKEYLESDNFNDYCPNGLQIEGKEEIKKVAFAVSATKDSIEKTVRAGADTLIVHHGVFWKYQGAKPIVGPFAKRIIPLVKNDINLIGYHLPLDAHREVGNAATLAAKIDLVNQASFGDYKGMPLGIKGGFGKPIKASALKEKLEKVLEHQVIMACENPDKLIESMGIITGGANSDWQTAVDEGLDSYLTGEISEYDWHDSQEAGICMFAGGHHATEKPGIMNLMEKMSQTFDIETVFFDSENPA